MDGINRIDKVTRNYYWAVVAFVIGMSALAAGLVVSRDYISRLDEAGQQAMSLAQALAEHTTQTFVKLDALSRAVIEDSTDPIVDSVMLSEVLRRRAAAEPAARAIILVDSKGLVKSSGIDAMPIGMDMSAAQEFVHMTDPSSPDYFISQPQKVQRRAPDDERVWTFNYARRLKADDGKFEGFVLIVVDQSYIYGFINNVSDNPGQILGLVGMDGIIKAAGDERAIGMNIFPRLDLTQRQQVVMTPSAISGEDLLVAYYRTAAVPLVAYAGFPIRPIFIAWLSTSVLIALVLAGMIASLVLLGSNLKKYATTRSLLIANMIDSAKQVQEKEFLESIIQTNAVAIAVAKPTGEIIAYNNSLEKLFPDIMLIQNAPSVLSRILGEDIGQVLDQLPWQGVRNVVIGNQEKRALSWVASPIYTSDEVLKNIVVVGLDVTERREAELAIHQSAKLVTLGEMATGIAHEINQPLATILMTLDNLHDELAANQSDTVAVKHKLATIMAQAERAATIVRHMRIYGRRSDGDLGIVDPVDAIDGALIFVESQIIESGISLSKLYRNQYKVLGDALMIEQIILNMMLNARDAILERRSTDRSRPDNIAIDICLTEDNFVSISIADTGKGYSNHLQEKLFDPFFTTKPVGQGMGLGLALSYGMARDMGGSIRAENTELGAKFTLSLRLA